MSQTQYSLSADNALSFETPQNDLPEWFTEISPTLREQHEQLAERVLKLRQLVKALSLGRDEHQKIADMLAQALHLLDYTRPYNISVIGMSGVGKSTLINALLGRDLLPSRRGLATTGTVVTVSQMVASPSEPQVRQALVYYHTHQTLTESIEALCAKLNMEPLYTSHEPPLVHISKTLKEVREFSTDLGLTELPAEFVMLEDLLQTAQHQRSRLEQRANPVVIALNSLEDIRRVQALMDEESMTNKKGSSSRVIPLIRHIDYQFSSHLASHQDRLAYINLTDTPGTAALTLAHDEQLRRQLNPFATDAIILVMKPDRPEAMIREMVPLIENVLMQGLHPSQRALIAERCFLVVNKTDDIAPERLSEAVKDVQEGVQKVGDKIMTGFCHDHTEHVFYNIKAQPALIAELILSYPEAARGWLRGEVDEHFRFNVEYYLNISRQAEREYPELPREEGILRWSNIRNLRDSLKRFLNRRWDQDLHKAQALYDHAHATISALVNEEWEEVTGKPFSEYPLSDLERLNKGQVLRYAQELRTHVESVLERFREASSELHRQQREEAGAEPNMQAVRQEIQRRIFSHTETRRFKRALMSMVQHPIFSTLMDHAGAPQALVELDTQIYQWFDQQVKGLAANMMEKLHEELERAEVESTLRNSYYRLSSYDHYLNSYRTEIIGSMQNQYENASRGAILYQMMTRRAVEEVRRDPEFRSAMSQPTGTQTTSAEVADILVDKIRQTYAIIHEELTSTMPSYLAALFFYHLNDAEKKLTALIYELMAQLGIDIADTNGELYQRIQASESSQSGRRARLYEYWQALQELK